MLNLGDGKHNGELLRAQAHIWNHIFNFINSTSLKCAIELGIPDAINRHGGKPMTASELVAAIPVNPAKTRSITRLMRLLVHSGFFALEKVNEGSAEKEGEGYVLTNSSRLLLKDNPLSVTPFLMAMLDPILLKPWCHVSEWFGNDDPTPFQTAHGTMFWDVIAGVQPNYLNSFFDNAMASDARLVTTVLVSEFRSAFDGLRSLVDVGGGTGTVGKAIAHAFPELECTVLDLPHVVEGLNGSGNLKFVGGDMFVEIPAADAVLLKWILHDWNDEECVKILKKSKEAIQGREGGKVIVIDMKINGNPKADDESSIETQLLFDMLMMALLTGRERDEEEWAKLFVDAGFRDYKITPILGLRSVIEVYP